MLTDAKIVGDAVEAVGERYDFEKLLDAIVPFLRGLIAEAGGTAAISFDAEEPVLLDDDGWMRLLSYGLDAPERQLIGRGVVTVDAGLIRVRLYLTGADALLLRKGDRAPTTLMDKPPSALDIVPNLVVLKHDGSGRFATREEEAELAALVRRHAPPGATLHDAMPGLRFPHEAFGAGLGPVRVHLVRHDR